MSNIQSETSLAASFIHTNSQKQMSSKSLKSLLDTLLNAGHLGRLLNSTLTLLPPTVHQTFSEAHHGFTLRHSSVKTWKRQPNIYSNSWNVYVHRHVFLVPVVNITVKYSRRLEVITIYMTFKRGRTLDQFNPNLSQNVKTCYHKNVTILKIHLQIWNILLFKGFQSVKILSLVSPSLYLLLH